MVFMASLHCFIVTKLCDMGGALGKKNPLWALVPVRLHSSGKSSHLSVALRRVIAA